MYYLVPTQYMVVQDGTWWYMKVHGSTMNGTRRRYMKVQDSTYWYIPVCTVLYCIVPCGLRRYMAVQDGT
jgi:hypothetical protein